MKYNPLLLLPLVLFFSLITSLNYNLYKQTTAPKEFFNPSQIIDKPVPKFSIPSIYDKKLGLSTMDIKGKLALINIFASWCIACRAEHDFLMTIKESGIVPIYGIAWKDKNENTRAWLERFGNPYDKIGADQTGEVVINFGITGAPESFLVGPDGKIIYHHIGPLTENEIKKNLAPLLRR